MANTSQSKTRAKTSSADKKKKLTDHSYYINRELSWLSFNDRVLEEAKDKNNPLLERLRFAIICENNLDEFFMVRVAGIKQKIDNEIDDAGAEGLTQLEQLRLINQHLLVFYKELYRVINSQLFPELAEHGVHFITMQQASPAEKKRISTYFKHELYPILTPLAIDNSRPFPRLANRSLNLAVKLHRPRQKNHHLFAFVQVPQSISRIYLVSDGEQHRYIWLQDIITWFIKDLFPGFSIDEIYPFKITRDSDLIIEEDEVDDLLATIQRELRSREKGHAVRLETTPDISEDILNLLKTSLDIEDDDIYFINGVFPLEGLKDLSKDSNLESAQFAYFTPMVPVEYESPGELFSMISKSDIFIHRPYHSFSMVEDFIAAAANDKDVLAIKMTLYRAGSRSSIIDSLIEAARNGKQVTALVELKARFDEETNIQWAKTMEEEGVHVVYGLAGLKTHCKVCMVMRKEGGRIERYMHFSTGNYNAATAKMYTDIGIFTKNEAMGDDITHLFNGITGYARLPQMYKIINSPVNIKKVLLERIKNEAAAQKKNGNGQIIAKMNSLVDADVIAELYRASQAGVQIELVVRGICCLRPGIRGISENIRVTSVVGRLLEHSRAFYFHNNGKEILYLSSADWMPRNFNRRIEIMVPIENKKLLSRIKGEVLELYLADNTKARELNNEGKYSYKKPASGDARISAQEALIERARKELEGREKHTNQKKKLLRRSNPGN